MNWHVELLFFIKKGDAKFCDKLVFSRQFVRWTNSGWCLRRKEFKFFAQPHIPSLSEILAFSWKLNISEKWKREATPNWIPHLLATGNLIRIAFMKATVTPSYKFIVCRSSNRNNCMTTFIHLFLRRSIDICRDTTLAVNVFIVYLLFLLCLCCEVWLAGCQMSPVPQVPCMG